MDTTDDPIVKMFSPGKTDISPVSPPKTFVDETFEQQAAAQAKKRKKMLKASVMTQDWEAPILGNQGPLGL